MTQAQNVAIGGSNFNSSGVLQPAGGGTGVTTTPTNGQIPIGNGTNYTAATITQGSGISITNGSGSITIAATASTPAALNIILMQNFGGFI